MNGEECVVKKWSRKSLPARWIKRDRREKDVGLTPRRGSNWPSGEGMISGSP